MANQDISLLFGVKGEGSLDSGSSGALIKKQLNQIMREINQDPLKVKVVLDTKSSGQRSMTNQLKTQLSKLSSGNKFAISISKLTIGRGALSDFKRQLQAVIGTLNIDKGTTVTVASKGAVEVTRELKETSDASEEAAAKVALLNVRIAETKKLRTQIGKDLGVLGGADLNDEQKQRLEELNKQYDEFILNLEKVNNKKLPNREEQVYALKEEAEAIAQVTAEMRKNYDQGVANERNDRNLISLRKQAADLLDRVQKAYSGWTAAATGKSRGAYEKLPELAARLNSILNEIDNDGNYENLKKKVAGVVSEFSNVKQEVDGAGESTKSFADRVGGLGAKFATWFSITRVIMKAVDTIKKMIRAVIELDDALTQLKIVTHATYGEMASAMNSAAKAVSRVGASIKDIIDATTTYARLGYSLSESGQLAEYTAMLQNVGNIEAQDAQNAVTAIIKAFKDVDAADIERVMDKLVKTGNSFPVSASQIAEGMNNASSALAAAGNTFDQSVALLTAANTTIQDASKSSTGLRTIAARLRKTKTELDDLGEEMTDAAYNDLISALTKANVSLRDSEGEFRSTYDIIADIARVWGSLTSMQHAGLAETISGTRQQAVFYSLIEQFQEASGAMEAMANSEGELRKANDAFMESTTAHTNQFKAAFQEMAHSNVTTSFLNGIIDIGTELIKVVDKLLQAIPALKIIKYLGLSIIASVGVIAWPTIARELGKIVTSFKALAAIFTTGFSMAGLVSALPAIISAVTLLATIFDELIVTQKEAYQYAEQLHAKYDETQSEIDSILSEIESNTERIYELKKLLNDGSITLIEQDELNNLEDTNTKLERQLELKRLIAAEDARESNDQLVKSFDKQRYRLDDPEELKRINDEIEKNYKILESYKAQLQDAEKDGSDFAELSTIRTNISIVEDTISQLEEDYKTLGFTGKKVGTEEYVAGLIKEYKELLGSEKLSELQTDRKNAILSELTHLDDTLQGYIESFIGDSSTKDVWQGISDSIEAIIIPAQYFLDKLSDISPEIANSFNNLGKEGKLTAETVSKFAAKFPELQALMDETGWTAEDVAMHFNTLAEKAKKAGNELDSLATSSLKSVADGLADLESDIGKASTALDEFENNGSLSSKTYKDLADTFGYLDSFDDFVAVLTDADSTTADLKEALEALAGEYVGNAALLGNLSDENAGLVQKQLELIGVENAEMVVANNLARSKINLITRGRELSELSGDERIAIINVISALYGETAAAGGTEEALSLLNLAKRVFTNTVINTSGDIQNLLALATAAGIATEDLKNAYIAKTYFDASQITDIDRVPVSPQQRAAWANSAKHFSTLAQSDIQAAIWERFNNISFNLPTGGSSVNDASSSSAKAAEAYVADIDEYREALERLERTKIRAAEIDRNIKNSDNLKEQILMQRELIESYTDEQTALHTLNDLRRATITQDIERLRELGFVIEYNADKNELWIENLDHLNELTAVSQGEYESMTEATNAFIKETEELTDKIVALNDANKDGSNSWWDLYSSIKDAREQIQQLLKEIVSNVSEAVDKMQNLYDTLHTAANEYASGGYVTIDTLQSIIELGTQYMQYLTDENGMLVINEERIRAVVAERTKELAIENAMAYVAAIRIAQERSDVKELEKLLYATEQVTDATWQLVYARLNDIDLTKEQRKAALHNIDAIRALAENAANSIGVTANSVKDELDLMKSGLDDIIKYTMDMLKQRVQDQIDAYSELVDQKKASLEATKKEADYQKDLKKRTQEIAKLQSRINALSLDNSREATAQRVKLEEELAQKQEELADKQSDYAREAQSDMLDDMKDAFTKEKNEEISSYQKLYDMAIAYIGDHWDTLYSELIAWNTEYGSVLNDEITSAWDNALAAAQRYGNYVSAIKSIDADIAAASGQETNYKVGKSLYSPDVISKINQMIANSKRFNEITANYVASHPGQTIIENAEQKKLRQENQRLGSELGSVIGAWLDENGVWWTKDGRRLYDIPFYHTGGIAGGSTSLKQNELLAVLEKGEIVLDQKKESAIMKLIDFASLITDRIGESISSGISGNMFGGIRGGLYPAIAGTGPSVQFGDVYIYGADDSTVEKHREVNRRFTNEVLKQLNIKR